jgi:hypothetical protein
MITYVNFKRLEGNCTDHHDNFAGLWETDSYKIQQTHAQTSVSHFECPTGDRAHPSSIVCTYMMLSAPTRPSKLC